MPTSKSPKGRVPPKVRAKTGTSRKSKSQKLDLGTNYLAAQAQSPVGAQIAAEATALKTTRDTLIEKNQELTDLLAAVENKKIQIRTVEGNYATALETYARRAAILANDDPTVLNGLGVEAAGLRRSPRAKGPAEMPSNVRVLPGEDSGSALMRWTRAPGAGAFVAQYKLEPEAAGEASSEWTPEGGFATKKVEWAIHNLPPAAQLRVRVRAIGAEMGPWSEEVLGRAR